MPYELYKSIHLLGIIVLFTGLGAFALNVARGADAPEAKAWRKLIMALHGVSMILILVGGFGAAAKLGALSDGLPVWVILKILVWLVAGVYVVAFRLMDSATKPLFLLAPVMGFIGAIIAVYKPFVD